MRRGIRLRSRVTSVDWIPTHRISWRPPGRPAVEILVADLDDLLYQADEWRAGIVAPAWTWDTGRGLRLHRDAPQGAAELYPLRRSL
jgi:hypothetical protein